MIWPTVYKIKKKNPQISNIYEFSPFSQPITSEIWVPTFRVLKVKYLTFKRDLLWGVSEFVYVLTNYVLLAHQLSSV